MTFHFARLAVVAGVAASLALGAVATQAGASAMLVIESAEGRTELTADQIRGLEQVTIETENDFSDGVATFEGPLARDVIGAAGAPLEGSGRFIAANDYMVEIPLEDFLKYDVIFATSMNGKRLSLRDKGPIWVIYPMSDHEELQDSAYNHRLIWQLVRIELE